MRALKVEIRVQAPVQCTDGPAGEASHVIVQPARRALTGIVVKEAEAPHAERLVPFLEVEGATTKHVRLRCTRQELAAMPPFYHTEFVETTSWWHGRGPAEFEKVERENIPDDEVALSASVDVRATDGRVGRLVGLTVDPGSGLITRFGLQTGPPWSARLVTVLISEVENISRDALSLKLDRTGIEALRAAAAGRR